jgi:hypothetical protein
VPFTLNLDLEHGDTAEIWVKSKKVTIKDDILTLFPHKKSEATFSSKISHSHVILAILPRYKHFCFECDYFITLKLKKHTKAHLIILKEDHRHLNLYLGRGVVVKLKPESPKVVNFWFSRSDEDGSITVVRRQKHKNEPLVKFYVFEKYPSLPIHPEDALFQGEGSVNIPKHKIKVWKTYYTVVTSEKSEKVTLILEQHKSTQVIRDGIPFDLILSDDQLKGKFLKYSVPENLKQDEEVLVTVKSIAPMFPFSVRWFYVKSFGQLSVFEYDRKSFAKLERGTHENNY